MSRIIENMSILFSSLLSTSIGVFSQKPLYNKEFIRQFNDDEDLKIIEKKVAELKKNGDTSPTEIELTNDKKITIVVN